MKPLLDYAAAAQALGISEPWLKKETQAGRVPCVRLGRAVRFSEENLDAIVAARTQRPKPVSRASAAIRRLGAA